MTIDVGDTIKFTTDTPGGFSTTVACPVVRVDKIEQGTDGNKILWVTNTSTK